MNRSKYVQYLEFKDGCYQGQVIDKSERNGIGIYIWDSGEVYYGEWKNDYIEGEGFLFFPLGGLIHGTFYKNKVGGPAYFQFSNGDQYEGFWKHGKIDGNCYKYFFEENKWISCLYKDGVFNQLLDSGAGQPPQDIFNYITTPLEIAQRNQVSAKSQDMKTKSIFVIPFKDGGQYLGIQKNNIPNGLGIMRYTDGKYDAGYYYHGNLTGLGRLNMKNGDIYDGFLKEGKLTGKGFFYQQLTQQWIFGYFEDNKCLNCIKKGQGEYPLDLIQDFRYQYHLKNSDFVNKDTPCDIFYNPIYYTDTVLKQSFSKSNLKASLQEFMQEQDNKNYKEMLSKEQKQAGVESQKQKNQVLEQTQDSENLYQAKKNIEMNEFTEINEGDFIPSHISNQVLSDEKFKVQKQVIQQKMEILKKYKSENEFRKLDSQSDNLQHNQEGSQSNQEKALSKDEEKKSASNINDSKGISVPIKNRKSKSQQSDELPHLSVEDISDISLQTDFINKEYGGNEGSKSLKENYQAGDRKQQESQKKNIQQQSQQQQLSQKINGSSYIEVESNAVHNVDSGLDGSNLLSNKLKVKNIEQNNHGQFLKSSSQKNIQKTVNVSEDNQDRLLTEGNKGGQENIINVYQSCSQEFKSKQKVNNLLNKIIHQNQVSVENCSKDEKKQNNFGVKSNNLFSERNPPELTKAKELNLMQDSEKLKQENIVHSNEPNIISNLQATSQLKLPLSQPQQFSIPLLQQESPKLSQQQQFQQQQQQPQHQASQDQQQSQKVQQHLETVLYNQSDCTKQVEQAKQMPLSLGTMSNENNNLESGSYPNRAHSQHLVQLTPTLPDNIESFSQIQKIIQCDNRPLPQNTQLVQESQPSSNLKADSFQNNEFIQQNYISNQQEDSSKQQLLQLPGAVVNSKKIGDCNQSDTKQQENECPISQASHNLSSKFKKDNENNTLKSAEKQDVELKYKSAKGFDHNENQFQLVKISQRQFEIQEESSQLKENQQENIVDAIRKLKSQMEDELRLLQQSNQSIFFKNGYSDANTNDVKPLSKQNQLCGNQISFPSYWESSQMFNQKLKIPPTEFQDLLDKPILVTQSTQKDYYSCSSSSKKKTRDSNLHTKNKEVQTDEREWKQKQASNQQDQNDISNSSQQKKINIEKISLLNKSNEKYAQVEGNQEQKIDISPQSPNIKKQIFQTHIKTPAQIFTNIACLSENPFVGLNALKKGTFATLESPLVSTQLRKRVLLSPGKLTPTNQVYGQHIIVNMGSPKTTQKNKSQHSIAVMPKNKEQGNRQISSNSILNNKNINLSENPLLTNCNKIQIKLPQSHIYSQTARSFQQGTVTQYQYPSQQIYIPLLESGFVSPRKSIQRFYRIKQKKQIAVVQPRNFFTEKTYVQKYQHKTKINHQKSQDRKLDDSNKLKNETEDDEQHTDCKIF